MVSDSPEHESREGDLLARLLAIAFLFLWILGVPFTIWRNEGWIWGLVVLLLSLAIWMPGWLHAWKNLGESLLIDSFGVTHEKLPFNE